MQAIAEEALSTGDVQALVHAADGILLPVGGGSKPALVSAPEGTVRVAMRCMSGITEYDPSEFTFTALAGTTLAEINAALAKHGQGLPFDPPLAAEGATIGGTVAAGLSGPRRWRFGGLRDFILGIRFVDGRGRLVRGGGKVVKNAAGFDMPKLFVGSLGRLGILTEVTFKVFPEPPAFATLRVPIASLTAARGLLARIATTPLELEAADLLFEEESPVAYLRIGGLATALPDRLARLQSFVGDGAEAADEADFWAGQTAFAWAPAGWALAKVPISPHALLEVDAALAQAGAARVYSVGGHVAWVAWPGDVAELDALLRSLKLSALLLRGAYASPLLGVRVGATTLERVKGVLDPDRRFLEF